MFYFVAPNLLFSEFFPKSEFYMKERLEAKDAKTIFKAPTISYTSGRIPTPILSISTISTKNGFGKI